MQVDIIEGEDDTQQQDKELRKSKELLFNEVENEKNRQLSDEFHF